MTACGHLSQTLDGLDGARKENGGRGMEEPRASIPLDYRFLHLSFYRYKRKRKGDAEKMEAVVRGTKTIEEFKRVRESIGKSVLLFPFFYAFFWSAYYDCQKKTNGKQKIFSCKKSVCEVSENTKNSGNRK